MDRSLKRKEHANAMIPLSEQQRCERRGAGSEIIQGVADVAAAPPGVRRLPFKEASKEQKRQRALLNAAG